MSEQTCILCILDGWGHRLEGQDNSILQAHTPTWDRLTAQFPLALLNASAESVGLPKGQMGNSEVGHMTIGAGRPIYQDLPRIDQAIASSSFKGNGHLNTFISTLQKTQGACHLLGLLSPGGVHAHQNHMTALATYIASKGVPVHIHAFLDGRDTPPMSSLQFLSSFLEHMPTNVMISTVGGRYYGMDRDNRWERIQQAYDAIVLGKAPSFSTPYSYIEACYKDNIGDEFIPPACAAPYAGVQKGDGLLMANFRADRARQILSALLLPDFSSFSRYASPEWAATLGMVEYSDLLNSFMPALFPPQEIQDTLGEIVAQKGMHQLRIAETEKYAHVTFFFNGGKETPFPNETRILVPSPQVATYDLCPEMSAFEVTHRLLEHLENDTPALIVVNYANADMVGHTGNIKACIKAVETLDQCLNKLWSVVKEKNYMLLITADHGNVEQMLDLDQKTPLTAHTLNPVPFLIVTPNKRLSLKYSTGTLADIAPTILSLLTLKQPHTMTGQSLIKES